MMELASTTELYNSLVRVAIQEYQPAVFGIADPVDTPQRQQRIQLVRSCLDSLGVSYEACVVGTTRQPFLSSVASASQVSR